MKIILSVFRRLSTLIGDLKEDPGSRTGAYQRLWNKYGVK